MASELNKTPTLFAFGNHVDYANLFNKINYEFKSNEKYIKSVNKLNILENEKASSNSNLEPKYKIEITTKYYDLNLDLVIIDLENFDIKDLESSIIYQECLEGVLLALNSKNVDYLYEKSNVIEFFQKSLDQNENCFKILIKNQNSETIEVFSKKFTGNVEDLIHIDLSKNKTEAIEDEFTDIDEFINSIFVHPWSNIELKDEKSQQSMCSSLTKSLQTKDDEIKKVENNEKTNTVDNQNSEKKSNLDTEVEKDDPFNFEDLLMNLSNYKNKAEGLDFEERKKFAENVVSKFWESIGGDEDEIGNPNDL